MKRLPWWTLLGVAGISLAGTLVGQSVLGQPDDRKSGGQLPPARAEPARPPAPVSMPDNKALPELLPAGSFPAASRPAPLAGEIFVPPAAKASIQPQETNTTSAPATGLGRQTPAVSLEWVAPATVRIRQPMACQLLVRNTSTAAVQNVLVRQRLPQGVVCKSSEPQAVNDGADLVWNLGALAPDQSRRINLQLVSQTRGSMTCQATVTFSGSANHQLQVHEPLLAVKMRAPEKVIAGEAVTILFAISNPGDGVAEAVKVKALLPEGLEHSRGKVIEVDVGNLAPKEVRTMQLVCIARGSGAHKCSVVLAAEGDINASDTVQLEVLTPKLDIAVTGPKMRYLDRHAVYVVKVGNAGSAPATNVEVSELLPAGFKFHQAGQGGHYQEATRTVSWAVGDLQPGQNKEITLDVIPIEPGEHRLLAQAKAARGGKTEAEARTIVEGLSSLLIELADLDDPVEVGADTAYELHVTNTGTKTETNVEVVCTLPEQFEFRGAKCSASLHFRNEGRELIFEPLPRLAPKADVIYRIQVRGTSAGDVRFRARIKADDLPEAIQREERTKIYSDESPARSRGNPVVTPNPGQLPGPVPSKTSVPELIPGTPSKAPAALPMIETTPVAPATSGLLPAPPPPMNTLPLPPQPQAQPQPSVPMPAPVPVPKS